MNGKEEGWAIGTKLVERRENLLPIMFLATLAPCYVDNEIEKLAHIDFRYIQGFARNLYKPKFPQKNQ